MSKITIKTDEDIELLRIGGKRLAHVVDAVGKKIAPGVHPLDLDAFAEKMIREFGDTPAFLGYSQGPGDDGFPATLCISINDGVVHGTPHTQKVLEEGDIVSIDCGLVHEGMYVDHARTFAVGAVSDEDQKLMNATKEALRIGIDKARAGNTVGDIGHAIETFVNGRYGNVRTLAGHGVGYDVHEPPFVPNYGDAGTGAELVAGMVIAIEPMLTHGGDDVVVADDDYTYITKDGSRAAHFEHTILITDNGPAEILTRIDN